MTKSTKDYFQYGLATTVLVLYFILVGMMLFHVVPPENKEVVSIIVGTLNGIVGLIVGYFFGTSKSSAEKDAVIASNTVTPPTEPVK